MQNIWNHTIVKILLGLFTLSLIFSSAAHARTIRAGLEQNPPLSFINQDGKASGLLVDLLDYMAARAGWEIEYVPDRFDVCLQKLSDEQIDLMVTIAKSPSREKKYDFNDISVVSNWGTLYSAPGVEVESFLDLNGLSVAGMAEDIHFAALKRMLDSFGVDATYINVRDFGAVFSELSQKRVDVGVVSRFFSLKKESDFDVVASSLIFNPIEVHYATAKGLNNEILSEIDKQLKYVKSDNNSIYYSLLEKWLGVPSRASLPQWLYPAVLVLSSLLTIAIFFMSILRLQVNRRTRDLREEIQKRKQAQEELEVTKEKYRTLVEGANAIILRWDISGKILYINQYGEQLFGYEDGELTGKNVLETIVPAEAMSGKNQKKMISDIGSVPEHFLINENENITKSGDRLWISWRNRSEYNSKNEFVSILSIGQDVSERKKAEVALMEYNSAKDSFVSTAAHELRTPLASVLGYAELLSNFERELSDDQKEFVDIITDRGEALSRIIDDLLDVCRMENKQTLPVKKKAENIVTVMSEYVAHQQRLYPTYNFSINSFNDEVVLLVDKGRLIQVLDNLVSNAMKYSEKNSDIEIVVQSSTESTQFSVIDQGIGIPDEKLDKIFDNFYRIDVSNTAKSGLGLGLGIVKKIVESHGGEIWVESKLNEGTKVHFTFYSGNN